ncbi:hypothetical protein IX39_04540 [Chryseobacterium formosense]|uniref:DUF3592 domain-containing protein n=1 Tax=Chryseobacterium formosense TaxID=236814 RepID=A0A085Z659_9FLAO|nr:hypothetical protein [Chryseobacterium formosense]KFE99922.1 hypothetical protein IX39_04540 [Chryseobacterium formosense]SFT60043.1 hypothetical protein SAMN05421857_1991 [Chryseobacterium formosense]
MLKNKQKPNKFQRIGFLLLIFGLILYLNRNTLIYRNIIDYIDTKHINAKIIDKKEGGRGSHMFEFYSYYYEFNLNGKTYQNPSYNKKYKIGDSIKVIYSNQFPFMNKPVLE